jgi:hypothetical protein
MDSKNLVRIAGLALPLLLAIAVTACSSSSQPSTPTGPSSAPASSGATILGTVVGYSAAAAIRPASVALTVSIVGTINGTAVDATGHFTLSGVPRGNIQLHFTGPNIDAVVTVMGVGDPDTIRLTVRLRGSSAEVEDEEHDDVELKGMVSAKTGTCPVLTFKIGATTVVTDSNTKFEDFLCSALVNGDQVTVEGAPQNNGTVLAKHLERKNGNQNTEAELEGTIAGKSGTCPTLTFTVSSTTVTTDANTRYENTSCSALANNMKVDVEGTKQSNGTVLATQIERSED